MKQIRDLHHLVMSAIHDTFDDMVQSSDFLGVIEECEVSPSVVRSGSLLDQRRAHALRSSKKLKDFCALVQNRTISRNMFLDHPHVLVAGQITDLLWASVRIVLNPPSLSGDCVNRNLHVSLKLMFLRWLDDSLNGIWDKELKFHTNYFFCSHMNLEKPPLRESRHIPGKLFFGSLERYVQRRCLRPKKIEVVFLQTILQGVKRGCPPLSKERIVEAACAHKERLTRRAKTPGWVLDQITRTAKEIWNGKVSIGNPTMKMKISQNACFENPRSEKGPLGVLLAGLPIRDDVEYLSGERNVHSYLSNFPLLWSMKLVPVRVDQTLQGRNFERPRKWEVAEFFAEVDVENLVFYLRSLAGESVFGPDRSWVKFILEPLKIRAVSKGSILSNSLFPEVQKQLWSGMQRFPCLRLTGRSVQWTDVRDVERRHYDVVGALMKAPEGIIENGNWGPKDNPSDYSADDKLIRSFRNAKWVSSDFSAATDTIHQDCTLAALEGACSDPSTFTMLRGNLCRQRIRYDRDIVESLEASGLLEEFEMTNGQLMGSAYSFPILCCINLAVLRSSFEMYTGNELRLVDIPALINGDDLLFRADDHLHAIWRDMIRLVGFEESVGKSFFTHDFAMINSTMFWTKNGTFSCQALPYLNFSFYSGEKKGSDSKPDNELSWNEKLVDLIGAFRDSDWALLDQMKEGLGQRWRAAIRERWDVRDSKLPDCLLGLSDFLEYADREQTSKLIFWKELRQKAKMSQAKGLNLRVRYAGNLERNPPQMEFPNISSSWKSFVARGQLNRVGFSAALLMESSFDWNHIIDLYLH